MKPSTSTSSFFQRITRFLNDNVLVAMQTEFEVPGRNFETEKAFTDSWENANRQEDDLQLSNIYRKFNGYDLDIGSCTWTLNDFGHIRLWGAYHMHVVSEVIGKRVLTIRVRGNLIQTSDIRYYYEFSEKEA